MCASIRVFSWWLFYKEILWIRYVIWHGSCGVYGVYGGKSSGFEIFLTRAGLSGAESTGPCAEMGENWKSLGVKQYLLSYWRERRTKYTLSSTQWLLYLCAPLPQSGKIHISLRAPKTVSSLSFSLKGQRPSVLINLGVYINKTIDKILQLKDKVSKMASV